MQTHHDKIIMFPKWKKKLEEESLEALKEKKYEKALKKLNKLLSYQVDNHELITGKLICLMELGRLEEAQDLCEEIIQKRDENYYQYVHIYLTILFQSNQYDLLMEIVEQELERNDIPKVQQEQFKQLYDISKKMRLDINVDKKASVYQELFQAVDDHNFEEQWRQVESLRGLKAEPTDRVIELLDREEVHPVAKSAIVKWLKESNISQKVKIDKFGDTFHIIPSELEEIESSDLIKETTSLLSEVEQKNPSLYQLLLKLLYDYAYVIYPIHPNRNDYIHIAKALQVIGDEYFGHNNKVIDEISDRVYYYIEKIKMSESLYLSIIDG